jgi:hypothetical protein
MNLRDFLQSASNAVAQNVSGPIDLITLGLNKAGLNVGDAPVGSTEWLRRNGLYRDVEQSGSSLAGETFGLLAPTSIALKAPKIASGILQAAENAAKPATLSKQAGVLAPKGFVGKHLEGMPTVVDIGGGRMEPFSTDQRIVDIAGRYMADKGMPYSPQTVYAPLDEDRGRRLAQAFAKMPHNPESPTVRKAFEALASETQDQYEALLRAGYKFDFIRGADPYGNPRNAINDIIENKRMSVFPTDAGFGGPASAALDIGNNPLLARSDLKIGGDPSTTYNDLFRAVHDVFGHAKHGVGFRARGEENAFQAHAKMYSPRALPAATSETRGQNSWVNFGPYASKNRVASPVDTEYAPQKTGLLEEWAWREGILK